MVVWFICGKIRMKRCALLKYIYKYMKEALIRSPAQILNDIRLFLLALKHQYFIKERTLLASIIHSNVLKGRNVTKTINL